MAGDRPPIPRQMRRDVLLESGYRCAMPTCREQDIDIHHIDDYAKVRAHTFDNLIALCPNCHRRVTSGAIDRKAVLQIKANLSVLGNRYGDLERRVLYAFAADSTQHAILFPNGFDILLAYIVKDGLFAKGPFQTMMSMTGSDPSIRLDQGIQPYYITTKGRAFITRWLQADPLD